MNDYTARNTARGTGKRGQWEVINYRTGKRPAFVKDEDQGHMTKQEAVYLAEALNRTMGRIERGETAHDE